MRKTIIEQVTIHAREIPGKVAIICQGKETTYSELYGLVRGYRTYLAACGVTAGDVVVYRASQTLDFVVQYLSIHSLGAVSAALERSVPDEGAAAVVRQLSARVFLGGHAGAVEDGVLVIPPHDVLEQAAAYPDAPAVTEFPDLAASADILFTTGTTGASKGVELSHNTLVATAESASEALEYKPDTILLMPGPLNHASGVRKMFIMLYNGSTYCILDGMMNMKAFFGALDFCRDKGHVGACLPPAAIRAIFQLTRDRIGEYAETIDFIESASAPLPEVDKQRLCRLLPGARLYNVYGSSESGTVSTYNYNTPVERPYCIGKATRNVEVLIVDDDRQVMSSSPEHMGLIACRGECNMKGYVNAPDLTAEVMTGDVAYTNDIGYIDGEGYIYILGRKGDVINVGGLKVAPTEVEAAMLEYPGVDDCICVGVPDPITGQALKAYVVVAKDTEFVFADLQKFLTTKLEGYKVPRFCEVTDAVKRTYNGKMDRKAYQV